MKYECHEQNIVLNLFSIIYLDAIHYKNKQKIIND
jgi:hypothetical protein